MLAMQVKLLLAKRSLLYVLCVFTLDGNIRCLMHVEQTGSPSNPGIIPQAISDIFQYIRAVRALHPSA